MIGHLLGSCRGLLALQMNATDLPETQVAQLIATGR